MYYGGKLFLRTVLFFALLSVALVLPAFAAENDKTVLPEVLIEAPKAKIKETPTTGTAIGTFEATTGTLTVPSNVEAAEIIQRTPGGAAVVDSKAFEKDFAQNFEDTLSFVPGVYATKRFAEEVRISIRGSGIERSFHQKGLATFQDGVPFNSADSSGDFRKSTTSRCSGLRSLGVVTVCNMVALPLVVPSI